MHSRPHPLAGRTVRLPRHGEHDDPLVGGDFRIEDWWDRVAGDSWREAAGNPAAVQYAARAVARGLPANDEVVYGKVGSLGYLLHVTEIEG